MKMDDNIIKSKLSYKSYPFKSVIELIIDRLKKDSHQNCLIDSTSGRKWTKQQVLDSCLNLGCFLVNDCNILKGDIVCFVTNNNDIHGIGLLGVLASGGVYCSLPRDATENEITQNVSTIKTSILVGISENFHILNKIAKQFPFIKKVLVFDEKSRNELKLDCPTVESVFKRSNGDQTNGQKVPVTTELDELATLVLTSGSTGTPKAIMRTNGNHLAIMATTQHPEMFPLTSDDIMISTHFCHICGQRAIFSAIDGGAQLVILGDDYSDEITYDLVHQFNVTNIFAIPTELNFLINNYNKYNKTYLKSLCDVFCGGAVLSEQTYHTIQRLYSWNRFRNEYGSSECGWVTAVYLSEQKTLTNVQTIGRVNPGFELKIIDHKSGQSLPSNTVGELCIRGDCVTPGCLGYSGDFQSEFMTNDGFFKSGDLAYYDDDQWFYFVSRSKDIINYDSYIVSPVELENILLSHEWVVNAAVIGIENDVQNEIPTGFVTVKNGSTVSENDLAQFVNKQVNHYKQLVGGVHILTTFPRTSLGKIDKIKLKQMTKQ